MAQAIQTISKDGPYHFCENRLGASVAASLFLRAVLARSCERLPEALAAHVLSWSAGANAHNSFTKHFLKALCMLVAKRCVVLPVRLRRPYYTAEEEEALKGQIMQCEGKCTVTRGNCYQSCGATKSTKTQRSANGCDCSWIANDDCINQDPCAVSCRQSHGSPCSVGAAGGAACHATCDSSFGSCNRWCHIPPGGGPYYTAEEEEALKGQIMQCEGKCTVTRGNCYQSCR